MSVYDALNRGQADTGTLESLLRVKPLEDAEQLVGVFHVESDPVVSNEQHYVVFFLFRASDFDFGLGPCAGEFYSVGNQVDQRQPQHGAISIPLGQWIYLPDDLALTCILADLGHGFSNELLQAEIGIVCLGTADSRKREQVVDQT